MAATNQASRAARESPDGGHRWVRLEFGPACAGLPVGLRGLKTVEEPTAGEDRQSTADESATTVTTGLKTVEEPTTGEAETGDGPVTDEIRVAVLVGGEFVGSDGISETTRFQIGSVTKMFTGVVLSQFHADGLIDLDVPMSTYLDIDSTVTTDVPGAMDTTAVGGDGRDALVEEFAAVNSLAHSAGVLVSTVEDLDRFVTALFSNQVAGIDEFLASTTDPQYQIPQASVFSAIVSAYGLGVMVFYDGTVGHEGQTIGFMSSVRYNPDTNESTIILVNDTTTNTDLILEQVLSTGTAPTAGDVVSFR